MIGILGNIKGFFNEVLIELKKCHWPTWPELQQSTIVVIISMLILSAFVGVSDLGLGWLIGKLYSFK